MRRPKILSGFVWSIWFALLVLTMMRPSVAQAAGFPSPVAPLIAGTYFIKIQPIGGMELMTLTSGLMTLTSDGNFIMTKSAMFEGQFSTQHGVWKQTETDFHQIKGKALDFNFAENGVAVITFVLNFDFQFRTVSGEFFGQIFPTGVDPLGIWGEAPVAA